MTSNSGTSWSTVNSGLTNLYISALTVNNGDIYAATNGGVFKTANGGQLWAISNTGLTSTSIWSLGSDGNTVFAGTSNAGVFRTTNDGAMWESANSGLPGQQIRGFGFNGSLVYCGVGGAGVYLSTNNGNSWDAVNTGLIPSENVSSFLPYGSAEILTTWAGVYVTTNNGGNWTNVTSNLSSNSYVAFSSVLSDADLYVGGGPGVWKRPISEIIVSVSTPSSEIPSAYTLAQNYPNPFNPNSIIRYELPMQSHVSLKVFDMLGREVATLVNDVKQPGEYAVTFDGSDLVSGVYFYRLDAGNFTSVKKLLLLK